MKKFLKIYKYYFLLPIIIIFSILIGFAIGRLTANAESEKNVVDEVYIGHEFPEHRTSLGEFMITAYCTCSECCGEYSDGYTATMAEATPGRTIAVDPDVIPYGTVVEINGDQYVAEDCGGAIAGNHIDILCASHELAESYGVQYSEVYIVNQ